MTDLPTFAAYVTILRDRLDDEIVGSALVRGCGVVVRRETVACPEDP